MSDLPPPLPVQPSTNWERATLEKLVLASINEQRAARRWKMGMRLAAPGQLRYLEDSDVFAQPQPE